MNKFDEKKDSDLSVLSVTKYYLYSLAYSQTDYYYCRNRNRFHFDIIEFE